MDTSKPDARHFNLPNHCKPFRAVYSSLQPLPISRQLRKPHYSRTKDSFKSALSIPTVSMGTFHSTNLFLFTHCHIPTNSVAPFSACKHAHNAQFIHLLSLRANA